MKVFILGLRHSGTTPFWKVFRQDPRFRCYNEPFNPRLRLLDNPSWKVIDVYREYQELSQADPRRFWETYRCIPGLEELQTGLSDTQEAYLRYLLASGEHVALDTTRCHFKAEALARIAPDAVLVNLWRSPASLATSHLVYSGTRERWIKDPLRRRYSVARASLRKTLDRQTFWHRTSDYRMFEPIVGESPRGLFGLRLGEAGLDPEAVYAMPAVGRILAYWRVNQQRLEQDGPGCFGERFISISFDDFCTRPAEQVARVYAAFGEQMPELELSEIHPPHGPHQPDDRRWARYLGAVGLEEHLPGGRG